MIETERSVVVMGAGLMGVGIALVFAQAGHPVTLVDTDPACRDRALLRLRDELAGLVGHGLLHDGDAQPIADRVRVRATVERAWPETAPPLLVIEAVSENLPLKRRLLADLDRRCPRRTLLATNTSGLRITAIAADMEHPERLCGMHFWNPPHLIPLVEVVRGEATGDQTLARAVALLTAAGKRPVVVRKDVPGFLGNRLLHALQREAMSLVASGVADAADVDLVVTHGFGRRLAAVGPLAVCDLAGLDLVLDVDTYLLPDLDSLAGALSPVEGTGRPGRPGGEDGQRLSHLVGRHDAGGGRAPGRRPRPSPQAGPRRLTGPVPRAYMPR